MYQMRTFQGKQSIGRAEDEGEGLIYQRDTGGQSGVAAMVSDCVTEVSVPVLRMTPGDPLPASHG